MKAFAVLAIAVVFALLAGCIGGGGEGTPTPAPTVTPMPAPTAAPSPTVSPAPTATLISSPTPAATPEITPTPTPTPTPSPTPVSTVDWEAYRRAESGCFGFLVGSAEEAGNAALAGATWVRPHTGPFAWGSIEGSEGNLNFSSADEYVEEAQRHNITILGTIWPFADWEQTCRAECMVSPSDIFYPSKPGGGLPRSRCKPCDMGKYAEFVKKLVERYDGDGVNDMPGLRIPVRHWEVSNEPEMREETLTFFKGSEADYVEILRATYGAVKEACPNCTVVQGGSAAAQNSDLFWGSVYALGGGRYFDVGNIHFVNFGDAATLNVNAYKRLLDSKGVSKPIWVTEAEYEAGTRDSQVESSVRGAFSAGASRVFFTRFEVGRTGPPRLGAVSQVYTTIISRGCPNS